MADFKMQLIRTTPGITRDGDDWNEGLINFGYEPLESTAPIALFSPELEQAMQEAEHRWKKIATQPEAELAEGYWIMPARGFIAHIEVKKDAPAEPEDPECE